MDELLTILEAITSNNNSIREEGEQRLNELREEHFSDLALGFLQVR